jgi:hypothetical protein
MGNANGIWTRTLKKDRLQPIKMALSIGRPLSLGLAMLLTACQHPASAPASYLPSRPSWEMFPRASSPTPDCPGQYRTTLEDSNGSFFLGCWGNKTN